MKRIFLCLCICLFTLNLSSCNSLKSYSQAKIDTVELFDKNNSDFMNAANTIVANESTQDISVINIDNITYQVIEQAQCVFFDYDAQGMLGGQYWGLYYTSDNKPKFEGNGDNPQPTLSEEETEGCYFWQESGGNNYYATERISENWFFYYMDYDGNTHGLSWNPK